MSATTSDKTPSRLGVASASRVDSRSSKKTDEDFPVEPIRRRKSSEALLQVGGGDLARPMFKKLDG